MNRRIALGVALALGVGAGALVAGRARTVALTIHNGGPRPVWVEVGQVGKALGSGGTLRLPKVPAGSLVLGQRGLYEDPSALTRRSVSLPASLSIPAHYVWNLGGGPLWVVTRRYGGPGGIEAQPTPVDLVALPSSWVGFDQPFPQQVRAKRGAGASRRGLFSPSWVRRNGLAQRDTEAAEATAFVAARDLQERRARQESISAGALVALLAWLLASLAPGGVRLARRVDLSRARTQKALAAGLIAGFMALNLIGAWEKSRTYDEAAHLAYGIQLLEGDARRTHSSVVPVTALNALPSRLGLRLPEGGLRTALLGDRIARLPTQATGGLLAGAVFLWARALYGFPAALLALLLVGFSPNLQAHARWTATDLYAAASVVFACWMLWRFLRRPTGWTATALGLALGVALVAKLSGVLLYPTVALILLMRAALGASRQISWRRWVAWGALALVVHLAVLNAAYRFQGTGASLADYAFESGSLQTWRGRLGPLARVPLPLPRPFLEGVDESKHNVETSVGGRSNNYLLGEVRQGRFPSYYPIAFALKVPLPAQLLFAWAVFGLVRRRSRASLRERELFLLAPLLVFGGFVTLLSAVQIGIRHLLVVLPLGHLLTASLLEDAPSWSRRARLTLAGALLWLAVSVLSWFPHTLCYFNELILDRKHASDVLADSNLDWGQNQTYVQRFLERNPDVTPDPAAPLPGRVLLSVNRLCGVFVDDRLDWHRRLRERFEPIDHVAYTHLLYVIPADRIQELQANADD